LTPWGGEVLWLLVWRGKGWGRGGCGCGGELGDGCGWRKGGGEVDGEVYNALLSPLSSYPIPSHPILSHPLLPHPIPSYPTHYPSIAPNILP